MKPSKPDPSDLAWRPDWPTGPFEPSDVVSIDSLGLPPLRKYAAQVKASEEFTEALDALHAAEREVAEEYLRLERVTGPEVDEATARALGFRDDHLQQLVNGHRFRLIEAPPPYRRAKGNYGSVDADALKYVKELTRLVQKRKLIPTFRRPTVVTPCGWVVTQGGAKVRLVVDMTASGLNERECVPYFRLPTVKTLIGMAHPGDSLLTADLTDMFLSFRLAPDQWGVSTIENAVTGQRYVAPWTWFGNSDSPSIAAGNMTQVARVVDEQLAAHGMRTGPPPPPSAHLGNWDSARDLLLDPDREIEAPLAPIGRHKSGAIATVYGLEASEPISHVPIADSHPLDTPQAVQRVRLNMQRRVMTEVQRALQVRGTRVKLDDYVIYVDDFGVVGSPARCKQVFDTVRQAVNSIGLDFKDSKTRGPDADDGVFLGLGVSLARLKVFVTEERRLKLLALAREHRTSYRDKGTVPLGKAQSLIGKLVWSAVACPAGYAYARRLWDAVAAVPFEGRIRHSRYPMVVKQDYWDDLDWWLKALASPIETSLTPRFGDGRLEVWDGDPLSADTIVSTDAADRMWGSVVFPKDFRPADLLVNPTMSEIEAGLTGTRREGTLGLNLPTCPVGLSPTAGNKEATPQERDTQYLEWTSNAVKRARFTQEFGERRRGGWSTMLQPMSINWKELKTVEILCRRFDAAWRGHRVLLRIDNETAMAYTNKGYGDLPHLTRIARNLKTRQLKGGYILRAVYVNTKANTVSDGLSRSVITETSDDWQFHPQEFAKLHAAIGFEADMYADNAGTNAHLSEFYCENRPAEKQRIAGRRTWWNPPWRLARRALAHLASELAQRPYDTHAVMVLPEHTVRKYGRVARRLEVVHTYPTGTLLFSRGEPGTTRHDTRPCRWPVTVLATPAAAKAAHAAIMGTSQDDQKTTPLHHTATPPAALHPQH